MSAIEKVAENIYLIDDEVYSIPGFGSVYLIDEEKKALVESGPAASATVVLDGIRRTGVKPEEIDYLIVTHVHLDHAGGAGVLIRSMPQAQVLVHYKGAKHLIDPSRLVSRTTAIRDRGFVEQYGEVLPIAAHRVQAIHDGDSIRLSGEQVLEFLDAPGHAPHELCIFEKRSGGVFAGDALGICFAGGAVLLAGHPPPGFNLEAAINTIERLIKLRPSKIYFSHFGASNKAEETLLLAMRKLKAWVDIAAEAIAKSALDAAVERMVAAVLPELEPIREMKPLYNYLTKSLIPMTARGALIYCQEQQIGNDSISVG